MERLTILFEPLLPLIRIFGLFTEHSQNSLKRCSKQPSSITLIR